MITSTDYILPTIYKGIKYRSRTEARWARFFDAAGIRFAYEANGIKLPSGNYLPDFELKLWDSEITYAEVKGRFSLEETNKCKELCEVTHRGVLMLDGPPDFKTYDIFLWGEIKDCAIPDKYGLCGLNPMGLDCDCGFKYAACVNNAILCTKNCKYFPFFWCPGFEDREGYFKPDDWYEEHRDAIYAAQNERFEIKPEAQAIVGTLNPNK